MLTIDPPPCSRMTGIACLHPSIDAAQVHRHDPLPRVELHVGDGLVLRELRRLGERGVVVEEVEPPELADGHRDHRRDLLLVADVGVDRDRAPALVADRRGDALGFGAADVVDDDRRAFRGEHVRGGFADARPGTGDDRDLPLDPAASRVDATASSNSADRRRAPTRAAQRDRGARVRVASHAGNRRDQVARPRARSGS